MYCVPDLAPSREYRFRLTASNQDGHTPASIVAIFRTLATQPKPPSKLVQTIVSGMVRIAWDDAGNVDGVTYVLEMSKASATAWTVVYEGSNREFQMAENLEPGSTYRFRVKCETEGGRSEVRF